MTEWRVWGKTVVEIGLGMMLGLVLEICVPCGGGKDPIANAIGWDFGEDWVLVSGGGGRGEPFECKGGNFCIKKVHYGFYLSRDKNCGDLIGEGCGDMVHNSRM